MKNYTFYTINTVIDIGDGNSTIKNGNLTSGMNLNRLLESIMLYSYPMMVSIVRDKIDLTKNNNNTYYSLPIYWGECMISTFKFALPIDVDIDIDGIPLVVPCYVNNIRISKFDSITTNWNISITKQSFEYSK